MSADDRILAASRVTKRFGTTIALDGASLDVRFGEIHGLVGHNGSGKSTFVKILTGVVDRDDGDVAVGGTSADGAPPPSWWSAHGVSVVHQDLGLVASLPVWENLLAGRMSPRSLGFVWPPRLRDRATAELTEFGSAIPTNVLVGELSDAERAELAIVRAVMAQRRADRPGILILDEPTAYLPASGVQRLFRVMREVVRQGGAVIFISHKLGEVMSVCDRITVLRDGVVIDTASADTLTQDSLVELMLGASAHPIEGNVAISSNDHQHVVVTGLRCTRVSDFSMGFSAGEIVGVTGLTGSGHDDIPYALFGDVGDASGTMTVAGRSLDIGRLRPRDAVRHGIALVPGHRLRDAIFPTMAVGANLGSLHDRWFSSKGLVDVSRLRTWTQSCLDRYSVKPSDPTIPVGVLSGGNQQKVVVAKWLEMKPSLLCLHEPTQGVDIGAKQVIIEFIQQIAGRGATVLVSSVETEELLEYCHRIVVMRNGRSVLDERSERLDLQTLDRVVIGAYENV